MTPLSTSSAEHDAYNELCGYTLTLADPSFMHQHVVDAFAAQHATAESKPIGITFALVGLYLHVEKTISGRQVQRVHMRLARQKQQWPMFVLPRKRGTITAIDVMAAPAGPERNRAIDTWCESVWAAFRDDNRQTIVELLRQHGIAA